MIRFIQKHAAIPILLLSIIVIAVSAFGVNGAQGKAAFALKDIAGNRQAMNGVSISGELGDAYHSLYFRLEQGQIHYTSKLFEQPRWVDEIKYVDGAAKVLEQREYTVFGSRTFTITQRDRTSPARIPLGQAEVTPWWSYNGQRGQNNEITFANALEYGLAAIGERVFFTTPVTSDYSGESGIYELDFYEWGTVRPEGEQASQARLVANLNLGDKDQAMNSALQVLGLEAAGDRLVLIAVKDGQLHIRSYHSETGKLLGELTAPNVRIAASLESDVPQTAAYRERYRAFQDTGNDLLYLKFERVESNGDVMRALLTLDLRDGVKLLDQVEASFSNEDSRQSYLGIESMSYRQGKLYVLRTTQETEQENPQVFYPIALPKHLLVHVYEAGRQVYEGEIVSDWNDDLIQAINHSVSQGSFGYDQREYRNFYNLYVH